MSELSDYQDRCLAADLTAQEWRLAVALEQCILCFWDKQAGAYKTEARLGEALLRDVARLDGRSFTRAREGLIDKGVIVRFEPPETKGRGHRSLYTLSETPAEARVFGGETPAETPAERPAETPAETPADPRGRTTETEEEADALTTSGAPNGAPVAAFGDDAKEKPSEKHREDLSEDERAGVVLCSWNDCSSRVRPGGSVFCATHARLIGEDAA